MKTKVLISCVVTAKLICAFDFTYACCVFSCGGSNQIKNYKRADRKVRDKIGQNILKEKNKKYNSKKNDINALIVASHLGLCCLPLSHKKDARLK